MPHKSLYLFDAHALCYRSYYAIKGLINSKGQATNAVYGFVKTIQKILDEKAPDYVGVCFDSPEKTLREKKFDQYKIQRPKMPDDLISQIGWIKKVVSAYNLAQFECGGYEADDIIATITQDLAGRDLEVVVVSEDKDLYQLANSHVKFLSFRKDAEMGHSDIQKLLGFDPAYMSDFLSLVGDKVDNIPGVQGVGKVSAQKLINAYGSLEEILNNLDDVKPVGVRDKITACLDEAKLSKELALLEYNVPVKYSLGDLKVEEPNRDELFEIFKEMEFKRLSQEFSNEKLADVIEVEDIDNQKNVEVVIKSVPASAEVVVFFENFLQDETDNPGRLLFSWNPGEVYALKAEGLSWLTDFLSDDTRQWLTFNHKETYKHLLKQGVSWGGDFYDILLAAYVLNPAPSTLKLHDLAWQYLQEQIAPEDSGAGVGVLRKLKTHFEKELKEREVRQLLDDIEEPLSMVLGRMEAQGIALDVKFLEKMSKKCEQELSRLQEKLFSVAGEEFNINSPKQLSRVLFEKLELPVIKKTKTGFSTDESVLTLLSTQHEVPQLILDYRQIAKLKSTYIDALPRMVDDKTGRIHAHFLQTGTETGRLSSKKPNLQNIPIRTEMGRKIRQAFIPLEKGHVILAADYSQVELRLLAHLSEDEVLIKAFNDGEDIHAFTASLIFDVDEKDVDYHMRDTAKRVNFGIIYGMSAFGLAKDLKITQGEAQEFINKYFARYPKVKDFMDGCIESCEKLGYVTTLLNRRRYIPEITSRNNAIRQYAQRQALNTPVQGSAADLIKLAMINIQKEIDDNKLDIRMMITVHDELVFDVPENQLKEAAETVKRVMESPMQLNVPVVVSVKAGKNWLQMREV